MTEILWGYDLNEQGKITPVVTDFSRIVNPHLAICGDSGSGKTYTLRHAISEVIRTADEPVRFHVFDVHGDIIIDESVTSSVMFSASSPYGFNAMALDPDPHFGGVNKCIQTFISTLKLSPTTSRSLGPKQQDVLRNLLLDTFAIAGFDAEDPGTWATQRAKPPQGLIPGRIYLNVPYEERNLAAAAAERSGVNLAFQRDGLNCWHVDQLTPEMSRWPRKTWGKSNPTMTHLVQYAKRRREMSFTGLGRREAELLQGVHKRAKSMTQTLRKLEQNRGTHGTHSPEFETAQEDLEAAKSQMLKATEAYLQALEQGNSLEALLRYDSFDSLSTVTQILESLNSSGIFRDTPPNFDPQKPIWRYQMNALHVDIQKFLLNVRLTDLFNRAVQRGLTDRLRAVVVIDEGAKFVEKEDEHIVNRIALEARKFGLAIWFVSQSPTQFSDTLMSMMGTKVILRLDPKNWNKAERQLRLAEADLSWISKQGNLLLNRKMDGLSSEKWVRTVHNP